MIAEFLSSDRAFEYFLLSRSPMKVALEDPIRRRWSSRELREHLYEEETVRLREVIHHQREKEKAS